MKRYEAVLLCNAKSDRELRESPTGDWYHRADLIAAGVLVPVPVGEARTIGSWMENGEVKNFIHEGQLQYIEPEDGLQVDMNHEECGVPIGDDDLVQRVRLVKLEDVG